MTTSAPSDLLPRLAAVVGPAHLLTDPADLAPYLREPRERYRGRARCVVRPKTRDEVAAILALCHETGTPLVPQGGNTGLVGSQTPEDDTAIVLSLTRMDALRDLDPLSNTMTVEAGMTLQAAQRGGGQGRPALSDVDRGGRLLHDRRQSRHQRRWPERDRPRQHA